MRIRLLFPVLTLAALLGFSAGSARAGSFFGPLCYGARYTEQYPNRSHNVFGCGPDCHCQAKHPFFRHRLFRRNKGLPDDGMPANAMPAYGMTPGYGMPMEYMQAPMVQSPMMPAPIHMTSVAPAPAPAAPAVQSRIAPVPSSGPVTAEPPSVDPPF